MLSSVHTINPHSLSLLLIQIYLAGLYDPESPLSVLKMKKNLPRVQKLIWDMVVEDWQVYSQCHQYSVHPQCHYHGHRHPVNKYDQGLSGLQPGLDCWGLRTLQPDFAFLFSLFFNPVTMTKHEWSLRWPSGGNSRISQNHLQFLQAYVSVIGALSCLFSGELYDHGCCQCSVQFI